MKFSRYTHIELRRHRVWAGAVAVAWALFCIGSVVSAARRELPETTARWVAETVAIPDVTALMGMIAGASYAVLGLFYASTQPLLDQPLRGLGVTETVTRRDFALDACEFILNRSTWAFAISVCFPLVAKTAWVHVPIEAHAGLVLLNAVLGCCILYLAARSVLTTLILPRLLRGP